MFPGFCTILFVGLRPHFPEVQLEFTSFKKKMKVNIEKMFHILLSPLMDSLGTEFQVEFNVPRDLEGTGRAAPCSLALLLRDWGLSDCLSFKDDGCFFPTESFGIFSLLGRPVLDFRPPELYDKKFVLF